MQINLEWLSDYIKLNQSVEDLTRLLTFSGIEVEGVISYGMIPDSVITARVVDCIHLEGSDHLQTCQVDTGTEVLQIVCGAPNCTNNIVVALALPGTDMGDFIIKKTRIRGTESNGMLCSEKELQLSDEHGGIIILPPETPLGMPLRNLFKLPDTVLELEITPNRPDLLGYIGLAKDLAASTGREVSLPGAIPVADLEDKSQPITDFLKLQIDEPELCPRYTARVLRNVQIKESPLWLKQRLLRSGLRPINNVVDITNYVMLESGHPLHAFDYDKLDGKDHKPVIIVRKAKTDEAFPALDGKTYILGSQDLVIADANKPVALAGVIGGANSHITDSTVNIVLEAACFQGSGIRRTAYQHKISTDSAYRFERHLAVQTTEDISERAAQMIVELCCATLCSGVLDSWQAKSEAKIIPLRQHRFEQVIGIKLTAQQMIKYLSNLGLDCLGEAQYQKPYPISKAELKPAEGNLASALYFAIPPKRVDLEREIDLIEEIIRLHGMDQVPQKVRPSLIMDRHAYKSKRTVSDYLVLNGFQEVVNLSFTDPELLTKLNISECDIRYRQIALLNPQNSNLSVMRSSLLPQLLQNAQYNLNHGEKQFKLFELNKVFYENNTLPKQEPYRLSLLWLGSDHDLHWKYKPSKADFYQLKGYVQGIIFSLGNMEQQAIESDSPFLVNSEAQVILTQDKKIAEFGKLHPAVAAKFGIDTVELKQDIWIADLDLSELLDQSRDYQPVYTTIARYPSVERDISFLIRQEAAYAEIIDQFTMSAQAVFSSACLIDEYRGKQVPDGFRSLTFRLVFNSVEKTLTDDEVEAALASIINNLKSQWDIQLR